MLIMPEKFYRVCLNCGHVTRARLLKTVDGQKEKKCPHCGVGENSGADKAKITEYQGVCLFNIVKKVNNEFYMTDELRAKYTMYYDAYSIPDSMRVY